VEEERNPWEKTKKIVRQPVKQHDESDEESHTETRKAKFTKSGTVPKAVGSLVNTPNQSDTEKSSQRSGNSPMNPFLESKTDNYRKGRGAGSDAEPESMGEVLSRLKNKKQAGGKDRRTVTQTYRTYPFPYKCLLIYPFCHSFRCELFCVLL
jgi:hypothetical protein